MQNLDAIPLTAPAPFDLIAGDRALVVNAHPDDEAVFQGKSIRQMVDSGVEVYSVTASDGEQSTKGDQQFVRSGQRRHEAQAAFEILGVAEERQYYFSLPDGRLDRPHVRNRLAWKTARLMIRHSISIVITPGEEGVDGHPDHQAVHKASILAGNLLRLTGRDVCIWGLSGKYQADVTLPVDTGHKLLAAGQHISQRLVSSDLLKTVLSNEKNQNENYSGGWAGTGLEAYENLMSLEAYRRYPKTSQVPTAQRRDQALPKSELY